MLDLHFKRNGSYIYYSCKQLDKLTKCFVAAKMKNNSTTDQKKHYDLSRN